jgi:hypothetical protein
MQNAQSFNLSPVIKLRLDYLENFTGIRKPNASEIIYSGSFSKYVHSFFRSEDYYFTEGVIQRRLS